ncbi:recombinase family protein [Streptomyces sp. NPDC001250]|uniref:recombinase family protein n=1 Tax=unclassified Streptomyces TaxID=2593676 RepID=UPI00332F8C63
MKRHGRDAAELTALADHLTAHGLILKMFAGSLPGIYDPTGPGKLLFAILAAMAENARENIRESTLEVLDTASRKNRHGGRPPVITHGMPPHRAATPRERRVRRAHPTRPDHPHRQAHGTEPSVASIYRALAEHEKKDAYPEAVALRSSPRGHRPEA